MNKIKVTTNAWKKITDILKKSNNNIGFIYSASSGGCNGFNFELNLLNKENHKQIINNKFYTVLNNKDTKIYVDPLSELYLLGTTIDYIKEDYANNVFESKFVFKPNRDLATTCGCGVSFNPK